MSVYPTYWDSPLRKHKGPIEQISLRKFKGYPCPYCREKMHGSKHPTRDHVLPISKGGTAIIIACWECNHRKDDIMPDVFLETLSGCDRTRARLLMIGSLRHELLRIGCKIEITPNR